MFKRLFQKVTFSTLLMPAAAIPFLFTVACSEHQVQVEGASTPDVATIAVARAATENLSQDLVLTAEFKPYQEVDVMAKVAGYIKQINVDVGDRVKQNQVLATLEIPEMADDLTRSNASLRRSEAEVLRARDEYQRAQAAHQIADLSFKRLSAVSEKKPGLVAQQEIDDARSKDLVAEAQISAAKSALAVAEQQVQVNKADVQKSHTLMGYTKVLAPFTGVVTKRYADNGSMIQAGTASHSQAMPVVRISDNSMLRLILPVPESAVSTVRIGQRVEVRVASLKRNFPGRVARFAERLSLTTRTMDTEVDVPNSSLVLIPGMYAEVNLALSQRNGVLTIPVIAVDREGENAGRVMVVTANNRVEYRKIALGIETAHSIEVRSGLNEGDMVVLTGRPGLHPGEEVRPKVTTMRASAE